MDALNLKKIKEIPLAGFEFSQFGKLSLKINFKKRCIHRLLHKNLFIFLKNWKVEFDLAEANNQLLSRTVSFT